MADVSSTLEFLARNPLYETHKPYIIHPPADDKIDLDDERLHNMIFDEKTVDIKDVRAYPHNTFNLESSGFEYIKHDTAFPTIEDEPTLHKYQEETEAILKKVLGAELIKCVVCITRTNAQWNSTSIVNVQQPLNKDRPVKGAHVDYTFDSAPPFIHGRLTPEERDSYFKAGYRFRIMNTWRPLLPKIEDRPLAVCDARTILPDDLVAVDRFYPGRRTELYYLLHNAEQQWYWMSGQKSSDLLLMAMYDSKGGAQPRYCPHVSFPNPLAPADAVPRESVETRCIVITRE